MLRRALPWTFLLAAVAFAPTARLGAAPRFAIAHVQSTSSSGSTTTLNGVAAGSLLTFAGCAGAAITAVSDSTGDTVTELTDVTHASVPLTMGTSVWYVKNATAGNHTLTRTGGFGSFEKYAMSEYSGIDATAPYDKFATVDFSNNFDSGSTATTSQADELLIGVSCNDSNRDNTPSGSSFTDRQHGCQGSRCVLLADRIVSSTGAYNYTVTNGGLQANAMSILTFKAGGGGGGSPSVLPAIINQGRGGGPMWKGRRW